MTNDERIAAARGGSRAAFAELYRELYPMVYRFAYLHTRSTHDAEDVAADAFLRALDHVRSFRGTETAQFRAWVLRIARNVVLDRARRTREPAPILTEDDHPTEDPTPATVERLVMERSLASLSEEHRTALVLRYVLGLSARETGAAVGKSEGAIEQMQRRALAALARELNVEP